MKFAVGDEVIVVKDVYDMDMNGTEVGWIGRVNSSKPGYKYNITVYMPDLDMPYGYNEENLELLSVYNSPLYSALK